MELKLTFACRFAILWTMNNRKQGLKRAELKLLRGLDDALNLEDALVLKRNINGDGAVDTSDVEETYEVERSALDFAKDELNARLNGEGYPAQVGLHALDAYERIEAAFEEKKEDESERATEKATQ